MNDEQAVLRHYDAVQTALHGRLHAIAQRLASADMPAWAGRRSDREALEAAAQALQNSRFVLAVVGEFSSGKSFLLNALLGAARLEQRPGQPEMVAGLLATDINPSTATITELSYSAQPSAIATYPSGREERIPLDRLSRFIAVGKDEASGKLHDDTAEDEGGPTHVRVAVDSPFLQRGFLVADTPGLASINPAHRRATLTYLPGADAVLYLIDTQQPFTEGDASFLGIIRKHIDSVFIVQTKIDLWQMSEAGRPAWENANRRIVSQAAQHAPETPVFPVSAREYAFGVLKNDPARVAASRFPDLLEALDRSLVATAGRARLGRALRAARTAAERALAQIDRELAAYACGAEQLIRERERIAPGVERVEHTVRERIEALGARAQARYDATCAAGEALAADLERTLALTLDTADIARVRDRNKLHVLVDGAVARTVGAFAERIAAESAAELREIERSFCADEGALLGDADIAAFAAARFGQTRGAGVWAEDLARAIGASIVLGAIGGPAAGFVESVAREFAAHRHGEYMKRELLQDLKTSIYPRLRTEIAHFSAGAAEALAGIYRDLAAFYASASANVRDAALGTIDRVLASLAQGIDAQARAAVLRSLRSGLDEELSAALAAVEAFAPPRPVVHSTPESEAIQRAAVAIPFDAGAYDRGLRPERWRVVLLGAFHRGKSALINAIAGTHVLGNAPPGVVGFPIHVRYGPERRVYALRHEGAWEEVGVDAIVEEAIHTPVLIEEPWKMPKELVLVHAPPFDTGDPRAEEICLVSARAASEILCLFSRQLSDRELDLYERVADLGKPLTFVHTIADNEAPAERRQVVELAARYLQERGIKCERMFTISAREYDEARSAGRAPAGWNETGALVATLQGHAETHMARLESLAREADERRALISKTPEPPPGSGGVGGLLKRMFGKG